MIYLFFISCTHFATHTVRWELFATLSAPIPSASLYHFIDFDLFLQKRLQCIILISEQEMTAFLVRINIDIVFVTSRESLADSKQFTKLFFDYNKPHPFEMPLEKNVHTRLFLLNAYNKRHAECGQRTLNRMEQTGWH